jgi:pimeloyl-ACP methyl ester carboxylesterase
VAFLITLTGGGISPRATETFDYERNLRRGGFSDPVLSTAQKAIGAYFDYLSGKAPRSEVVALLDSGKDLGWPEALGITRVLPSDSQRPAWSWVATFDPGPSIGSLRLPVLTLIGGRDRDPAAEVSAWQAALLANGDPRTEIRVVPSAGHVLTLGESHARRDFNNKALTAMASWAAAIVRP